MNNTSYALGYWQGYRGQRPQPALCDDAYGYSRGYEDGMMAAAMALEEHQQLARHSRQKRRDITTSV